MTALAPRRTRLTGVLALLVGAPVCAELLQSYLDTGAVLGTVFFVVVLAPLYGGAALLIREVGVRTGRGWPGRLLMAAAFGVLMPTWVDGSLFIPARADIDYWDDIMDAARVGRFSAYAVTIWVMGHVVMSIGAPLAVVEGLLPEGRDRAWLGRLGLTVLTVLGLGVAVMIHANPDGKVRASALDYVVSLAVAALLVILAMTRWGRPVTPVPGRSPGRPGWLALAGFVLMLGFDGAPMSWAGVVLAWVALLAAGLLVLRLSRSPGWSWRHLVAVAFGALLARTLTGYLAPVPQGVDLTAKLAQNTVFLLLVLALGALLWVRTRPQEPTRHNDAGERATSPPHPG